MKTISKLLISAKLLFFLLLTISSCKDKNSIVDEEPILLCEDIWLSIPLRVSNQHGAPIKLDDYYTIKTSTGEKISFKSFAGDSILKANGRYLVLSDSQKNKTDENGADFVFYGFRDGHEIIRQTFKIGSNKCHVYLISGPSTLTINE